MKYLIIYAHPNKESLNYSILKTVSEELSQKQGVELRIIDLYDDKFDPSLNFNSGLKRRDLSKQKETALYMEAISWADQLIFIYPTWWGRGPAVLMGFIDKVFVADFAFKSKAKGLPLGLLKGKSARVITTLKGPGLLSRIFYKDVNRRLMRSNVLNFCGIKDVRFLEIGMAEQMTESRFKSERKRIKHFVLK